MVLPNNKTGNNCAQKGIRQDGAHVTEKVPLKDKIKGKNGSQRVYPAVASELVQCESLAYPLQAVASVEDDGRQENIEEDFGVKGHLSHKEKRTRVPL